MRIQQLQVATDAIQDRLLLRISTQGKEEIRVFITRRFLRELWPALTGMLFGPPGTQPGPGSAQSPATTSSFDQPYRNEDPSFPLGSTPLLPAEAAIEPAGDGACKLTFREMKERSFTLTLDPDLLHSFCSMLRATSDQAGWDLSLEYGAASPAPGSLPSTQARLH